MATKTVEQLATDLYNSIIENPDEMDQLNMHRQLHEKGKRTFSYVYSLGSVEIASFHITGKPQERKRIVVVILDSSSGEELIVESYDDHGANGLSEGDYAFRYESGVRKRNPTVGGDIFWPFEEANLRYSYVLAQILEHEKIVK